MSILHDKSNRRILPRWRLSSKASGFAEFSSIARVNKVVTDNSLPFLEVSKEFEKSPSIGMAADLISAALLAGNIEKAGAAVRFVLEHEKDAPYTLLNLAQSLGGNESLGANERNQQLSVAYTRELLRTYPNNPMLWSDMARHFASKGNKKQAYRCMQTAFNLAPNHRWMLRTHARFLVHQGDAIAAHKLLAKHSLTRHDPWLIAAELACAQVAGRPPKYWGQAGDILKRSALAPVHLSELATAVAMMELEAGDRKKARKSVNKGLLAPTENTLAQVFWAKENRHLSDGFKLEQLVKSTKDAYEAEFKLNLENGDFLDAIKSAEIWASDEPFASRPRLEVAYIASLLDDYTRASNMVSEVERLDNNPEATAVMNKIFSILSSGKLTLDANSASLEKIRSRLTDLVEANKNSYHAMANLGLWHYRYGDKNVGKEFYQGSILVAQKQHLLEPAALAATFWAREAILSKDDSAESLLQQSKDLTKKAKSKAGEFYIRKLDALYQAPTKAAEILSPHSAALYIKSEPKPFQSRMEKTDQGHVIWVPSQESKRFS